MFRFIFLGLLLLILGVSAQELPCPVTFPEECSCDAYGSGPDIYCVATPVETWDIQATFDAVSEAFNDTDAVMYRVMINPNRVMSPSQEILAHSVSTLKIEKLDVWGNHDYTRIDPEAFSGTHSTTTHLRLAQMDLENAEEAFALFNNFQVLRFLGLDGGVTLSHIPPHAFNKDLPNLSKIIFQNTGLQSIGDLAFAQLSNLTDINLEGNQFTLANISDTAFTFAKRRGVLLNLQRNRGITYLPEEKFGNFLRGNRNPIFVGTEDHECDPGSFLYCDDRVDWICEAGITRIYDYRCHEKAYHDIYDYCEQKFGNSPLYRRNFEEVEKIQTADRLRFEKLKIEEEFHRRSYATHKAKRQNTI